jgi:hypothetical protein
MAITHRMLLLQLRYTEQLKLFTSCCLNSVAPLPIVPSVVLQAAGKLETQFNCPFCNGESTVGCVMDWDTNTGKQRIDTRCS